LSLLETPFSQIKPLLLPYGAPFSTQSCVHLKIHNRNPASHRHEKIRTAEIAGAVAAADAAEVVARARRLMSPVVRQRLPTIRRERWNQRHMTTRLFRKLKHPPHRKHPTRRCDRCRQNPDINRRFTRRACLEQTVPPSARRSMK
jgi:hypothetical protein